MKYPKRDAYEDIVMSIDIVSLYKVYNNLYRIDNYIPHLFEIYPFVLYEKYWNEKNWNNIWEHQSKN